MSDGQNKELDNLLDLLENGIPIDGNHPGMANLTRDQQKHFIALLEAD